MAPATPILNKNILLFTSRTKTSHYLFNSPKSLLTSLSLCSFSPSPNPSYRITRVSTAPVEYAPPSPDDFDFHAEIYRLKSLRSVLSRSKTLADKLRVIDTDFRVNRFFSIGVCSVLNYLKLNDCELFLLKCLVAAGQEHVLGEISESVEGDFVSTRGLLKGALHGLVEMIEKWDVSGGEGMGSEVEEEEELQGEEIAALRKLLKTLGEMEEFYDCIGGIIGLVSFFIHFNCGVV